MAVSAVRDCSRARISERVPSRLPVVELRLKSILSWVSLVAPVDERL
jgi:hypothetical protein